MKMRSGMGGNNKWQLFNLVNDPQESTNLSAQYPKVFAQLLAKYEQYAERHNIKPVLDDWTPRPGSE